MKIRLNAYYAAVAIKPKVPILVNNERQKETESVAKFIHGLRKSMRGARANFWREYALDTLYMKKYGISRGEVDQLIKKCGGVCEICGSNRTNKRLAVDHDHGSGKVRGMLCCNCNSGIGMLKDDPALLRKAAKYLDERKV